MSYLYFITKNDWLHLPRLLSTLSTIYISIRFRKSLGHFLHESHRYLLFTTPVKVIVIYELRTLRRETQSCSWHSAFQQCERLQCSLRQQREFREVKGISILLSEWERIQHNHHYQYSSTRQETSLSESHLHWPIDQGCCILYCISCGSMDLP